MACGIRTGDASPIHAAPYRRAHKEREEVDEVIQKWLKLGVIEEAMSPWASSVVAVRKKDGTIRCCADYRAINAVTESDVYPLPTLEEILSSLNGMAFFSSIDLNQGYLQIRMREEDKPKTAFIVQSGFYQFVRMPFGLKNAPAVFQRLMDHVLYGLKYSKCLVYLDDVIVFGRTLAEHNLNLHQVLQRLKEANLTIKSTKCAFGVTELRFLGHIC